MKTRLACAALISVFAASATAQDGKPAAPTVTPEAKAAFARMDGLIDLPVAKGLKSMTGVIEGAFGAGTVAVNFSFTAPATFTAESSGKEEPGTPRLLELAVSGARFVAWADADAETAKKDGKDVLILTRRHEDGGSSRAHYALDGDGLPASFALDWTRSAAGVTNEQNWITRFTWTTVGGKRRLAALSMRAERKAPDAILQSFAATFDYEDFGGVAVPTSWVIDTKADADAESGQRLTYRFTELSINGKSVALKPAQSKPAAADAKDAYVHKGSKLAFPISAAKFTRAEVKPYDQKGDDVGVSYGWVGRDFHILVTVYVYPALRRADGKPMPFDEQFEGEIAQVREGHKDVTEIGRSSAPSKCAGKTVATRTAEFRFRDDADMGGGLATSYLTAFRLDPWHVTYRVTTTLEPRAEAIASIEALLAELHLPPMNAPAAKGAEKR